MSTVYIEMKQGLVCNVWSDEPSNIDIIVLNHDDSDTGENMEPKIVARADAYTAQHIRNADQESQQLFVAAYESPEGYSIKLSNVAITTA